MGSVVDGDPVLYRKLSERLNEIFRRFSEQWNEVIAPLQKIIDELRTGKAGAAGAPGDLPEHCAPFLLDEATLRAFVLEKRFWIYTKLAEKDRLQRRVPRKEFVVGEGFLYLGRSHRLKLVDERDVPLKLAAGRFCLRRDALPAAREHFIRWYSERAKAWLSSRVADYRSRMEVSPAGVKVQDLGYRWGSCGKGDWLYFHWKAILLPARIAE